MNFRTFLPVILLFVCFCLFISNLMWGAFPIPFEALWGDASEMQMQILSELRLPRTIAALVVGGGLAVAGACLQVLLSNPLAEPGLLGISGGASLFAAAAIVLFEFSSPGLKSLVLSAASFSGALSVTLILFTLTRYFRFQGSQLLLLGVAIGMLCTAGLTWFFLYADDRGLRELLYWSMGSFTIASQLGYYYLFLLLPLIFWLIYQAKQLNLLLLGERSAFALGLDLARLRPRLILAIAMLVGICVALCGVIGFVGLLVPHLVRLLLGNDQRVLLPVSFVAGGSLMLFADSLAKNLLSSSELPVGIITASIGAPVFIALLISRHGRV